MRQRLDILYLYVRQPNVNVERQGVIEPTVKPMITDLSTALARETRKRSGVIIRARFTVKPYQAQKHERQHIQEEKAKLRIFEREKATAEFREWCVGRRSQSDVMRTLSGTCTINPNIIQESSATQLNQELSVVP